jgi:hypothetical protein
LLIGGFFLDGDDGYIVSLTEGQSFLPDAVKAASRLYRQFCDQTPRAPSPRCELNQFKVLGNDTLKRIPALLLRRRYVYGSDALFFEKTNLGCRISC